MEASVTITVITPTTYTPTIPTIVTTDHRESSIGGLDYSPKKPHPPRQKPPLCSATGGVDFWRSGRFFGTLVINYDDYND